MFKHVSIRNVTFLIKSNFCDTKIFSRDSQYSKRDEILRDRGKSIFYTTERPWGTDMMECYGDWRTTGVMSALIAVITPALLRMNPPAPSSLLALQVLPRAALPTN